MPCLGMRRLMLFRQIIALRRIIGGVAHARRGLNMQRVARRGGVVRLGGGIFGVTSAAGGRSYSSHSSWPAHPSPKQCPAAEARLAAIFLSAAG